MSLGGQFYGLSAIILFEVPGEMGRNLAWLKSPTTLPILTKISIVSMVVMKRDFNCNDSEAFVKSGLSLTLSW